MRVVLASKVSEGAEALFYELNAAGVIATPVTDVASLYLELLRFATDAVVIDLDNGVGDVGSVIRHLRGFASTRDLGIILLGTLTEAHHRVTALSDGADVYLAQPVEASELIVYLKNIARRRQHAETKLDAASWRYMQTEWRLVAPSGVPINLSHLESAFIAIVARNAGKPVKRREIISSAFGKDPLSYDTRRLEAVVSRLRRKVLRAYPISQPIKVVHSVGYVFTDTIICC
jgi:DNA-binding response OmpR family regulator